MTMLLRADPDPALASDGITPIAARWLVGAIVAIQCAVSLIFLRNSVSQDEALYLHAGKQILATALRGAPSSGAYIEQFSGLPFLYPPVGGALDWLGGLEAARVFSLVCMACSTIVVFLLASALFGTIPGVAAAGLFALDAPTLLIGRLATHDALCLTLLACAALCALRAGSRRTLASAVPVGLLLVLAVATKYVAAFYVPTVLALLAWRAWSLRGLRHACALVAVCAATGLAVLALAVLLAPPHDRDAARLAATTRAVADLAPRPELARRTLLLGSVTGALAVVGCVRAGRARWPLSTILLGTLAVAPAFHLIIAEPVSLPKHVGYGLLFAAPLAGLGLVALAHGPRALRLAAVALAVSGAGLGMEQAYQFYHEWPDDRAAIATALPTLTPTSRVLAEEYEIFRYAARDRPGDRGREYDGLYDFAYPDHTGQSLEGVDAYRAAIRDGYFDLVLLRFGPNRAVDEAIAPEIYANPAYTLIAVIPYSTRTARGAYWIWRKQSPSAEVFVSPLTANVSAIVHARVVY